MITFNEGSLFTADKAHSLGQCISGDVRFGMFRGISVEFLTKYPKLEKMRKLGTLKLGEALPVKIGEKYIYNLVTKPLHWQKPKRCNILVALKCMMEHAVSNSVSNIALPFIGSG